MTESVTSLLKGSPHHQVARSEGGTFSLQPRGDSEAALQNFQLVVAEVARAESMGDIEMIRRHESSDVGIGLVDLVIIRVL